MSIWSSKTSVSAWRKWVNDQIVALQGVIATALIGLSDVNTSTPTDKNFLIADGVDWESRAAVEADISDLYQNAVDMASSLTVQGAFTSLGIDDNASKEILQIADTILTIGAQDTTNLYRVSRGVQNAGIHLNGGNATADGSTITLYGSTHASTAADMLFRADNNPWMHWDESAGDLEILTGVGSKTSALTIDSSQDATFAGDIDIPAGNKITFDGGADGSYIYEGTSDILSIVVGGVSSVDFQATLTTFNDTVAVSDGINFPDTQSASSDVNTLDDYEEGTWTPVVSDGTNNATSSQANGYYTKVGNKVSCVYRITLSSLGSVSGATRITGLPFTSINDTNRRASMVSGYAEGLALTAPTSVAGYVAHNSTAAHCMLWDHALGVSSMLGTEWSDDGQVYAGFTYFT